MPITMDLRQAVIHKVHGKSQDDLTDMIEGSVDGPEAALPGLGVIFELIWKQIDDSKRNELAHIAHEHLQGITPQPLT